LTQDVVAALSELSPGGGCGTRVQPVKVALLAGAPPAAMMSLSSKVTGPVLPLKELTTLVDSVFNWFWIGPVTLCTNAVVATCVLLVTLDAVGAVGVPVN
jgi:hypothetical protein